ncbi:MAG: potassium transporter KefB [Bacteroidales bacterium]|nr:potassium transporter KefB [Bacteroidales bacterium]
MHDLLQDMVVIFALSLLVILLLRRVRVPSALAFLTSGIVAGPHGLGLVKNIESIERFAEVGVIFLLFTIGIEISLKNLFRTRRVVFLGGTLQLVLTMLATAGILVCFNWSPGKAIFGGFLTALSSTAIVLKMLQEQAELHQSYGRTSMGILIFQDMAVIPMMLLIPLLSGNGNAIMFDITGFVIRFGIIATVLIILTKWVVPWLLHTVALLKRRDLFLLTILFLAFAVAWMTSGLGISLALGAFFAGLVISESDYHHHAFGDIMPFRDIFLSFFFVSVGMLFDPGFAREHLVLIAVLTLLLIFGKTLLTTLAVFLTGYSLLSGILTGLFLSQVGEFSFVLARIGFTEKLLDVFHYQLFIAVAVITMAVTPFFIASSKRIAKWIQKYGANRPWITGRIQWKNSVREGMSHHLLIIGYGRNGRNIARAARVAGIPYVAVDVDPDIVRREKKKKENIVFGDATHEALLRQVQADKALVVAISVADVITTFRILETVRSLNPGAYVIVRTRYAENMEDLYNAGADEVIPEEIETSVRIFAGVLARFHIPREDIERIEQTLRARGYEMLLAESRRRNLIGDTQTLIPDLEIATYTVHENARAAGLSLRDAALRQEWGVTVLAIIREGAYFTNPEADMVMIPDDRVIVTGTSEKVNQVGRFFRMKALEDSEEAGN